jgi:thioesterase domain-containing protein/acyl carrier protein
VTGSQSTLRKTVESMYPLSAAQQGMLFESLFSGIPGIHIEQTAAMLDGRIDREAFERAWRRVVERHAVLRTAFIWNAQDQPVQVVLAHARPTFRFEDWSTLPDGERSERIEAFLDADRKAGFDFAGPPLLRVALVRCAEDRHLFVLTNHHILMDGWCLSLILAEFFRSYASEREGQELPLPPARPYRDYISWLRKQDLSRAESFWRARLRGYRRPITFGEVKTESDPRGPRHAVLDAALAAPATAWLSAAARRHGVTLNAVVQGAWALVLGACSDGRDVVFGATVSGRPHELPGVETMVGLFINSLPMRCRIEPERDWWGWIREIGQELVAQQPFEFCSAGQIHRWSELPSGLPLFETLLVFENYPFDAAVTGPSGLGFTIADSRSTGAGTRHPLTLLALPGATLAFRLVYDVRRVEQGAAQALLDALMIVLRRVAGSDKPQVGSLLDALDAERLPRAVEAPTKTTANPVPPRDSIEQRLARIWQELLGASSIGITDNFFERGGHSLLALTLLQRIRQEFDVTLSPAALFPEASIERIAESLRRNGAEASPLVPLRIGGTEPPLFCVPGAAANAVYLHGLARSLGDERPFYAFQPYGLEGDRAPQDSIAAMAATYVDALLAARPDAPYLLAGHSLGSWVALEMASQLRAKGRGAALLIVLDTPAPAERRAPVGDAMDDLTLTVTLARLAERLLGKTLGIERDALARLAPARRQHAVAQQMAAAGLFAEGTADRQLARMLEAVKAHGRANLGYRPPALKLERIVLLRATEAHADDATLHDTPFRGEASWGWDRFSLRPVPLIPVPGDHVSMLRPPYVEALANAINQALSRANA